MHISCRSLFVYLIAVYLRQTQKKPLHAREFCAYGLLQIQNLGPIFVFSAEGIFVIATGKFVGIGGFYNFVVVPCVFVQVGKGMECRENVLRKPLFVRYAIVFSVEHSGGFCAGYIALGEYRIFGIGD